jgi:hypothetical protein
MPAKKKAVNKKTSVKRTVSNKNDLLIESSVDLQRTILALVESNNALNKKIDTMVNLFDRAAGNIDKIKEGETRNVENLARRLNSVVNQNKDLAHGLVLLEEYVRKRGERELEPKEIPE